MADEAAAPAVRADPQQARFDDWVRAGLCYIVVVGFVVSYLYGQYTGKMPDAQSTNTYTNYVMLALGFYLGSSYGSNSKSKETQKP